MKSSTTHLTRRERQIMDAVYAAGEASAAQIRASISDPPSYSAVRALLRILEDKGHLRHKRDGLRYVYLPIRARHRAARSVLRDVVKTFFGGSVEQAVVTLLSNSDSKLSREQSARLASIRLVAAGSAVKKSLVIRVY
jgi:predicted transcriptional regulator